MIASPTIGGEETQARHGLKLVLDREAFGDEAAEDEAVAVEGDGGDEGGDAARDEPLATRTKREDERDEAEHVEPVPPLERVGAVVREFETDPLRRIHGRR
jgi:hypothetical protein